MLAARFATAGMALRAIVEVATASCRAIAPTTRSGPSTRIASRPSMPERSIRQVGLARRCLIVGISVMPPARNLPSSTARSALTASATEVGRRYAKSCMDSPRCCCDRRSPATRFLAAPILRRGSELAVARAPDLVAGGSHRADDVPIAGASTEIPFQPRPDVVLAGIGVAFQQFDGAHHHARRAETALQRVVLMKGLLNGV